MQKTWQRLKQNNELFEKYFVREQVLQLIRAFFAKHNYHEVEVPVLVPSLIPESYLEVFATQLLDRDRNARPAYLTPSPEIFLKKLLVSGIGNCYSLTKSFRNTEDRSLTHNPEFTMLEWYHVGVDYKALMDETEALFTYIAENIKSKKNVIPAQAGIQIDIDSRSESGMTIEYQGKTIDLVPPWERLTMVEAFQKHANIDLLSVMEEEPMRELAKKRGYKVSERDTWEQLFHQIYLNEVEPKFGQSGKPTIIYEFPSQMAALSQKKKSDPRFAERFEVFIAGLELADGYSELQDWQEQEARFKAEVAERKRLGKIEHPYDQDFIEALKVGLPKCAGIALGVDRLIMLFADTKRIQDTLFFPGDELWSK